MRKFLIIVLLLTIAVLPVFAVKAPAEESVFTDYLETISNPQEKHLDNVRMLAERQGAEAYFSFDDKKVIFQSRGDGYPCDQQYIINADGTGLQRVSNGTGMTTCGHFFKDGSRIIYASTFETGEDCPPMPSPNAIWKFWVGFDVYSAKPDGSDIKRLTKTYGYDAECTVSPDGKKILFTSMRTGDPEIFIMDTDGSNVRQLTFEKGDDGGAWFSPDGTKICFRGFHPKTEEEIKAWDEALSRNELGRFPHEIYIMDADGSNKRQITNFNMASFAPYFSPDGEKIIFSSNRMTDEPWNFEVYVINLDGTGLERITYNAGFDGFPMFSYDGKKLIFVSKRGTEDLEGTVDRVFIADWLP